MWKLDEALELIRAIQPHAKRYGYHVCLGGGVLNKGESEKDLDLYFLSLDNAQQAGDPEGLLNWLRQFWGMEEDLRHAHYASPAGSPYLRKVKFTYEGLRIDAFIIGGKQDGTVLAGEEQGFTYTYTLPVGWTTGNAITARHAHNGTGWDGIMRAGNRLRAAAARLAGRPAEDLGWQLNADIVDQARIDWVEADPEAEAVTDLRDWFDDRRD